MIPPLLLDVKPGQKVTLYTGKHDKNVMHSFAEYTVHVYILKTNEL